MKKTLLKQICFFGIILSMIFFIKSSATAGNLLPKNVMFKTANEKIEEAKKLSAHIYVPESFNEGMEYYREAEEMYNDNEDSDDIKKKLKQAVDKFDYAIDNTNVSSVFFTKTMLAREDALRVKANELDVINWNKAEEKYREAAETLEDGDTKDAKIEAEDAERLYRNSELKAIQTKYLKNVWALLNRAENMNIMEYAPLTLTKAQNLAKKSAALLHLHRYDQKEAAQLAKKAEYEINHAIYLAKTIKNLEDENKSYESILLVMEGPLQKIGVTLDLPLYFDNGMEIPTQHIVNEIKKIQDKNIQLAGIIKQNEEKYSQLIGEKDMQLASLQGELGTLKKKVGNLSDKKAELWKKVEQERIRKEKIKRISSSFSPSEGKALMDGDNIIIRLYGLTFPQGKSVIEPQYFSLLSKVKIAFSEFPGSYITVEGHTDSVGSNELNQRLSEERAEAVRQYMIANSKITRDKIYSVGYGESRPVASNKNESGRAMNRRIDFLIQPSKKW
jgi:outer membrane protein OmpA-like peptidoglycan-associated protein